MLEGGERVSALIHSLLFFRSLFPDRAWVYARVNFVFRVNAPPVPGVNFTYPIATCIVYIYAGMRRARRDGFFYVFKVAMQVALFFLFSSFFFYLRDVIVVVASGEVEWEKIMGNVEEKRHSP